MGDLEKIFSAHKIDTHLLKALKHIMLETQIMSARGLSEYEIGQILEAKVDIPIPRYTVIRLLGQMEGAGLIIRTVHPTVPKAEVWRVKPFSLDEKIDLIKRLNDLLTAFVSELLRTLEDATTDQRSEILRPAEYAIEKIVEVCKRLHWLWSEEPYSSAKRARAEGTATELISAYFDFFTALVKCTCSPVATRLVENVLDQLLFARLVFGHNPVGIVDTLVTVFNQFYDDAPDVRANALEQMIGYHKRLYERIERAEHAIAKAQKGGNDARLSTEELCRITWPMIQRIVRERRFRFDAWPYKNVDWEKSKHPPSEVVDAVHEVIKSFDKEKDNLAAWIARIAARSFEEPAEVLHTIEKVCTLGERQVLFFLYRNPSDDEIEQKVMEGLFGKGDQIIQTKSGFWAAALRGKKRVIAFIVEELADLGKSVPKKDIQRQKNEENLPNNRLLRYLSIETYFKSFRSSV